MVVQPDDFYGDNSDALRHDDLELRRLPLLQTGERALRQSGVGHLGGHLHLKHRLLVSFRRLRAHVPWVLHSDWRLYSYE